MALKDYELEFCVSLHAKLKEKIKGKIYTTIRDNVLFVEIYVNDLGYAIAFDDFWDKLNKGITTDNYANVTVQQYKKYIIGRACKHYFQ